MMLLTMGQSLDDTKETLVPSPLVQGRRHLSEHLLGLNNPPYRTHRVLACKRLKVTLAQCYPPSDAALNLYLNIGSFP